MTEAPSHWVPLAALGAPERADVPEDVPLAYLPRIPEGNTYREMLERAVAWGRR
ncbi:MAG: hypothetical protein ACREDK_05270 [Thermoplasmata archaeon]